MTQDKHLESSEPDVIRAKALLILQAETFSRHALQMGKRAAWVFRGIEWILLSASVACAAFALYRSLKLQDAERALLLLFVTVFTGLLGYAFKTINDQGAKVIREVDKLLAERNTDETK